MFNAASVSSPDGGRGRFRHALQTRPMLNPASPAKAFCALQGESNGIVCAFNLKATESAPRQLQYRRRRHRSRFQRWLRQDNFVLIVREENKKQIEKDVGFNLKDVSQIRFKETIDLETSLTETIKKYYGLP